MGILGKGLGEAIKPITDLAGKFIEDKDKKNQFEQELSVLKLQAESELAKTQKEVTAEALRNNTVPVKTFVYVFLGMIVFNFIVAVIIQFFPSIHYVQVAVPDILGTIILTIITSIFGKDAFLAGKDAIVNNFNRKKITEFDNSRLIIKCLNDRQTYNTIGEAAIFYNVKQSEILEVIENKKNDINGLIFIKTTE